MDWITQIVSQPITQGGAVVGILVALHKWGVIDLKKALIAVLKTLTKEEEAAKRNDEQTLLSSMEVLSSHYNHETTPLLEQMVRDHREFRETQLKQCGILEESRDILRDVQRNGIRIRN